MTIVELIDSNQLGVPEEVAFGYIPDVRDPPEILKVIEKTGSRVMSWPDALPAIIAIGTKPAPRVRVETTKHTILVRHEADGWRILDVERRPGRG